MLRRLEKRAQAACERLHARTEAVKRQAAEEIKNEVKETVRAGGAGEEASQGVQVLLRKTWQEEAERHVEALEAALTRSLEQAMDGRARQEEEHDRVMRSNRVAAEHLLGKIKAERQATLARETMRMLGSGLAGAAIMSLLIALAWWASTWM